MTPRRDLQGVNTLRQMAARVQTLSGTFGTEPRPETPDLALIVINASRVVDMLEQCAAKGIPYVIIFSSGFSEVGGGCIEM